MCEMSIVRPGMNITIIGPDENKSCQRVGQVGRVLYHGPDGAWAFMAFEILRAGQRVSWVGSIYPAQSLELKPQSQK